MRPGQSAWPDSEDERRKMIRRCGVFAALGWIVLDTFFELLFGPHVRLLRSLAIGAELGAVVGLLTSSFQWLVLAGYAHEAGALIPVSTISSALAGLMAGLLLYALNQGVGLYAGNVPLQGAFGAVFVTLVTTRAQWVVIRKWASPGKRWRTWFRLTAAGSLLGAATACIAWAAITNVFGAILGVRAWPYILLAAHLTAGILGGALYGGAQVQALRQVLPAAGVPLKERARRVRHLYSIEGGHSRR